MTPKSKGQYSRPSKSKLPQEDTTEAIRVVDLYHLKFSSRTYYVTISPLLVHSYELMAGDVLKISIIEARKHRERAEEPQKEWKEEE
jgi:hypothetical protein